jgi:hypothetical protein
VTEVAFARKAAPNLEGRRDFVKRILVVIGLAASLSTAAHGAGLSEGARESLTRFRHFPAGSTVSPALLFTDVVPGEAYESAGLSRCDFLLGFETAEGTSIDLWGHPEQNVFWRYLEHAGRRSGAYLSVLKRSLATLSNGAARESYEVMRPRPKIVQDPTPGNRLLAATVFTLVVTGVDPHSEAEALGLRKGDIIFSIGRENAFKSVSSAVAAQEALESAARSGAGSMTLEACRCEPSGEGYLLHKRGPITFTVPPEIGKR